MPPSCALLGGFAIGARVALLWQHWKCVAEPSGNPPGPPHAACMPHTHTTHAGVTPLAGDKIDAPAACTVPFRPYCGGVVTRTRNVSEYMLVLALCLVAAIGGIPARSSKRIKHRAEYIGWVTKIGNFQTVYSYISQMIRVWLLRSYYYFTCGGEYD